MSAEWITVTDDGVLQVPDEPIIPFIEGDGTGVDIWPAAQAVLDAAAKKHGKTIAWKEVLAGQKAFDETGEWLPDETVEAFRHYLIGIKGPVSAPSTWRCARSSTSTSACGRCDGSRGSRARSSIPRRSTW
jgi:isocitrate dehydrogenase